MKMENKRAAQAKKNEEKRKAQQKKKIRSMVILCLAVVVVVGLAIWVVVDARLNGDSDTQTQTQVEENVDEIEEEEVVEELPVEEEIPMNADPNLTVENGDKVAIDYAGFINEFQFEGGTGSYDLVVGSGSFIPGFEEQLIGHHPGESFNVEVTFPEDYNRTYQDAEGNEQSFNGAPATFIVNVKGIYK